MAQYTQFTSNNKCDEAKGKKRLVYTQKIQKRLPLVLENPVIQEFLKDEKHKEAMHAAFKNPSQTDINLLNQTFKTFYRINRVVRYCSVLIRGRSQDFDKRERKRNFKQLLVFDKNALEDNAPSIKTIGAVLDSNVESPELSVIEKVEEGTVIPVVNEELYKAMRALTDKQRKILYYRFEKMLTNRQIAEILGETEQNIGYWVKKTLKQLRDSLQ
ncbi:sigma-70 family RNA polymerase sigma factor [Priestia sp. TSO9]|uniref:sigma-70 family RNA polymerase sigma factor n=1 Tax=Priestia sp. TSO9 TaxID=2885632 RepID=UPI001E2A92D1|nr:sigma-70 family RNA polymerase sigma factor [Priestia sp. TSO9]